MSLAPEEGKPQAPCPDCGRQCGIVRVDVGTDNERELLVDLDTRAARCDRVLVWVEQFSGHPPRGSVLPVGALHAVHVCR